VAGEASLGCDLEFLDEIVPVATELPALHGLDLLVNCAPASAAPEIARAALRAEVPCIDCSGAFASHHEVPLAWAARGERIEPGPLLAAPVDAALVWLPILRALAPLGPIARVSATILEGASAAGRASIDALSRESLALFSQQELAADEIAGRPLAFDTFPTTGDREAALAAVLARALAPAPVVSARWIQVPVFIGQISALELVGAGALDAGEAAQRLAKAPGVELWEGGEGPSLRAVVGRDIAVASRPEADSAQPGALRLWAAGDLLRLAAVNAVAVAVGLLTARGALEARGAH
jgi:aspartate-semialdehyde dehydrogenase